MAGVCTNTTSKRRASVCVVLAFLLCLPQFLPGVSAEPDLRPVQIAALANPSPTIQLNRDGQRIEHARHRISAHSAFVPVRSSSPDGDRGQSV